MRAEDHICCSGDRRRIKRGLAVVQVALRQDADHVIGVQVNWVGIRRCAIAAAPAHNLPRPGPEEVFPRHREGRLDPRVPDATATSQLPSSSNHSARKSPSDWRSSNILAGASHAN